MDWNWDEYAEAEPATYITVHRKDTEDRRVGKVIVGSAEPFHEQRVENVIESTLENTERRKFPQRGKKTSLRGFFNMHVFRDSGAASCSVLKEMNLMA